MKTIITAFLILVPVFILADSVEVVQTQVQDSATLKSNTINSNKTDADSAEKKSDAALNENTADTAKTESAKKDPAAELNKDSAKKDTAAELIKDRKTADAELNKKADAKTTDKKQNVKTTDEKKPDKNNNTKTAKDNGKTGILENGKKTERSELESLLKNKRTESETVKTDNKTISNEKAKVRSAEKKPGAKKQSGKKDAAKKEKTSDIMAPATDDKALLDSGIMLYNSGNYTAALEKLKQVKEKFPNGPYVDLASQWLARTYIKLGDNKNAVSVLEAIPSESGEYPAAVFLAGQILFAQKDYPGASEKFYRVSAQYPMHELADDALTSLAKTNLVQGNGNQAVENLLKVIKNYSDRDTVDDAYYNLGKVYEKDPVLRDLEKARSIYKYFITKAEAGDPIFASSPLRDRVKRDLDYINRMFFPEAPLK